MDEQAARQTIVEIGRLLYARGHVVASDGNLSIRLADDRIIATPTMLSKGRLTEDSLAITDLQGAPLNDRRASSELKMHLLVYQEREDVRAVCHAHPAHGTAFAVAGLAIDEPVLSEVILALGCVPLAPYGTPSTAELTDRMRPLVKHHNALLMANHGAVAYGKDLWQAFDRMETLDHTARVTILARALGGSNKLPADAIEKLINVREQAGFLTEAARCQSCGYLEETGVACSTNDRQNIAFSGASRMTPTDDATNGGDAGNDKIALTRAELIDLLDRAVRLKS